MTTTRDSIQLSQRDDLQVLQLQHGKANALDLEFLRELSSVFGELSAQGPKAVVLTGTGKIFSAGVDLPRLAAEGADYLQEFWVALNECFRAMLLFPRPMVAAVNGHAIAGGCIMAAAADHRIMALGEGTIGVPELAVGVPYPALALEMARMAVHAPCFESMIYSCHNYSPEEAKEIGLVHELVAADQLLDRACAVARKYGSRHRPAFELVKAQVRGAVLARAEAAALEWDARAKQIWASDETQAKIRAFVEQTIRR